MRRLPTYTRLYNSSSHGSTSSSRDNLLHGLNDTTNAGSSRKLRYLMRNILHEHMSRKLHACRRVTERTESSSSSRLATMWKRIKKVFSGGRRSQRNMTDEENMAASDLENGLVSPSVAAGACAAAAAATGRSPTPTIFCERYPTQEEMLKQLEQTTASADEAQPTYNSIKNGDIETIDMKVKVEAWVANLDNPSTRSLTAAYMSSASSSISSSKRSCVLESP